MGDGGQSETTVEEPVRIDGGMRLAVDEISLMSDAAHGAIVLLVSRKYVRVVGEGVFCSASGPSLGSSSVDGVIMAGMASRCSNVGEDVMEA